MSMYRSLGKWLIANWYTQLTIVFTTLLIFAWIRCFDGYWWDETYTIIHAVLLTTFVAAALISSKALSITVQLLALILINLALTDYEWISFTGEIGSLGDWKEWLEWQFQPLTPYLWLSLGIWAGFHVILLCSKRRLGIIAVLSFILLSLTITDSLLSPVYLWGEIAWTVFIGLAWLVANHFLNFKEKHPESWAHLLEYPVSLFLPVLLIITLVMGAGIFVPSIDPILKDPYTAWKEARGEEVISVIGDKGTGSGSESKGNSASGYSRNDEELGNGFKFDYSPVMDITTTRKSYWRGETRALYTGSGWEESPEEQAEASVRAIVPEQILESGGIEENVETIRVDQSVNILSENTYPVLFGASPVSQIVSVNEIKSYLPSLEWLPQSWELRLPAGKTDYPDKYSIISEVPVLDVNKLRSVAAAETASEISSMYLQLPSDLPSRVRELALDITKNEATPYDKVKAIEAYLQTNFKYTNEPDLSKRQSKDFVDAFLFEMLEGYCDYYSTAMAVMTRSIGVPTRWVKGYAPGSLPIDPETLRLGDAIGVDMNPEGKGTYTVRNADAHSWVEVYFEGYGWFPFEPTAGFTFPYAMPENQSVDTSDIEADSSADMQEAGTKGFNIPLWSSIAAFVVLLLVIAVWQRRQIAGLWNHYRWGAATVNERIVRDTNRLIHYGRKKGLNRGTHETVRETISQWSERMSPLQRELSFVIVVFEKAMYSNGTISKEEAEQFDATIKNLRKRIS
ncbi:hypothetical protein PAECIP111893_01926 [Paenibacillus plantiphilus]|uniref:Transglutaminase-like domain-containing protein n=1 Tax=Paenibacillus plantiphilus TaxID=2905650 RepID=A0ABM9C325_9BACL|nr:transglutaminase-like domain-containing protein [Paenibacillus plantiphilus]CAH1202771.1 hypothetical protein PAECIP111893_01926 [Paenibacillus plantiphilus]